MTNHPEVRLARNLKLVGRSDIGGHPNTGEGIAMKFSRDGRRIMYLANENPPKLRTHDRYGNRIDEVEFHPSWHRLLGKGVSAGLTAAWARPGGHVRRAAGFVVWSQVEAGNGCPLSMTHAAVPALRTDPVLAAEWEPRLTSTVYDRDLREAIHPLW